MTGSRNLSRIVNRLRLAAGGIVSHDELVEALYYDRDDGGALNTVVIVRVLVGTLRRKYGLPIATEGTRGYFWRVDDLQPSP